MSASEIEALKQQIADLQLQLQTKEAQANTVAPYSASFGRTMVATILNAADGGESLVDRDIKVGGWVRTGRTAGAGAFAFLEVNDGSCFASLQALVTVEVANTVGGFGAITNTGTSVLLQGQLTKTPEGTKQKVELKVSSILYVGPCDNAAGHYPLSKTKLTIEFLRELLHLRPRSNAIGAVMRVRNALAYATHLFFQTNGFYYVHTPIISTSDCEGAGEMFQVTTLLSEADVRTAAAAVTPEQLAALAAAVSAQGGRVAEAKAASKASPDDASLKQALATQVDELKALKHKHQQIQEAAKYVGGFPRQPDGKIDYSEDFFGKPAYLTVSGQLQGEIYACSLSNIYTFGPTFRAENSNTRRHLAEFWMIEPEMAFCDIHDDMQCAEDYVKYCCNHVLTHCRADLEFVAQRIDKTCIARLENVAGSEFKRVPYTEAITLLEEAIAKNKVKFDNPVSWGIDLASEHEEYLAGEHFKGPIIVYNYPKEIKAFYMRLNDDGKTVAAMDVLVPKIGELVGGSQREERLDVLEKRLVEGGMSLDAYQGYLDLRRYGSVPHAGFGLGFERLVMFATGMSNIRDVIPFPRWPGHADS